MIYSLYKLDQSALDIGADKLCVVATRHNKFEGGAKVPTLVHRNKYPATQFFSGYTLTAVVGGWTMTGNPADPNGRFLELGADHGCAYRIYDHANKDLATSVSLLVYGSEEDLCYANPQIRVELSEDKLTARIFNETILDGVLYHERPIRGDVSRRGLRWSVNGVRDGSFGKKYIAEGVTQDLNVGAGRINFVTITKDPTYPVFDPSRTPEVDDIALSVADYYYMEADQADLDSESLSMSYSVGVKNALQTITVPLKMIFQ